MESRMDSTGRHPGIFRLLSHVLLVTSLATVLGLASVAVSAEAHATTWNVNTYARTEAEVRSVWSTLRPTHTGAIYTTVPRTTAPYAPGATVWAFRQDGAKMLNFGRYLAGLPADVTLQDARNLDGQYGAVLLQKEFSHTPDQPADMPDGFYARAYASTTSSNIGWGYFDLASFQKDCLFDGHSTNVSRVGHRRWLLNPRMLYTGMGFAGTVYPQTATTYAFDRSRLADAVDYPFVAWPSAGIFPVEHASVSVPWSITLNSRRYDWDASGHTVVMKRVSDGRTWTFTAADTNPSGEYFNVDFGGYGDDGNAFIFRPAPSDLGAGYQPGDQFDVSLSGGIYAEGTRTPVTVTYRTSFGALSGGATPFAASTLPYGVTPPTGALARPVATTDHYVGVRDRLLDVPAPGVLVNDSHPGGLTFRAVVRSTPANGTLTLSSDGSFQYRPKDGWVGADAFTYQAEDPFGMLSEVRTVSITVLDKSIVSVEGSGRVETAIAASKLGFPGGSKCVVIATARSFPDALGGSALAGALHAPILLTEPATLSAALSAEIARLGASHVIVLGGTGAVSDVVFDALAGLPGVALTERIAGANRYTTADKIAERTITEMGGAWDGTAFVATGESFPDALGASPIAAAKGWPIYLVHPNPANHDALVATMEGHGVTSALILGGTGPVPATLETKLDVALGAAEVDRLAGNNRYTTALTVAGYGVNTAGLSWDGVAIATGEDFPDALSGGALQGASNSVMLLAYPGYLHTEVANALSTNKASITEVRFLGGTGAVPLSIRNAVVAQLQ